MSEREPTTPRGTFDEILRSNGIDINTDDRTKQLALRGRIAELDEEISLKAEKVRPQRGAPQKVVSIDVRRALRVLGLAELLHENGCRPRSLLGLVRAANEADAIILEKEKTYIRLFPKKGGRRVENSVRTGLGELGVDLTLYRKNPTEFFVRCRLMFG